jgi:uncharacterized protein YbjT (DUF2867 family)
MPGDLTRPETLDSCLRDIETVFLVWTAPPDAFDAAFERIAKHAKRIVYLSAPLKTPHPLFQQPNPARSLAERIERTIETSGLTWTFLRPGMFAANALGWWAAQIRAGGVVRWPYLSAPTAPIDERDIAAVAVRALRDSRHAGAEYVLTGPQSLTQREQIEIIGRGVGRSLRIEELSPEEARRDWQKEGWPPIVVNLLLNAWAAAIGQPAFVSTTFQDVTGTPPRTFQQWATDHAGEFQK